jgi:hypothetical protein
MEIRNAAHIAASPDHVWASITDIEGIVPCIPGATLTERLADDRFAGEFRVKVGPLGLTLAGEVVVEAIDEAGRAMRFRMTARDRRGMGQASGDVSLTLSGEENASDLEILADATLQGPIAQFGRPAIISAIGSRILGEFARCLEARFAAESDG